MISPRDIANKQFSKSTFGGYRVDEVDQFLNEVADTLSKLLSSAENHEKELNTLSERIEQYRKQEETLSSALIGAQRLGDNIVKEAKNKAELTIRDAGVKSDRMVEGARREREREEKDIKKIKKEISDFKANILEMYKSHLELVTSLPSMERDRNIDGPKKVEALNESFSEEEISPESPVNANINEPTTEFEEQIELETQEPPINSQRTFGFVPDLSRSKPVYEEVPDSQISFQDNPINPEYLNKENYSPNLEENYIEKADEDYEKIDSVNRSNRFGELRFGDNYLINRDDEKKKTNKRKKR